MDDMKLEVSAPGFKSARPGFGKTVESVDRSPVCVDSAFQEGWTLVLDESDGILFIVCGISFLDRMGGEGKLDGGARVPGSGLNWSLKVEFKIDVEGSVICSRWGAGDEVTDFAPTAVEEVVVRPAPLDEDDPFGRGGTAYAVWRETWPGGGPVGMTLFCDPVALCTGPLDLNSLAFSSFMPPSSACRLFSNKYPRLDPPPSPIVSTMKG